LTSACPDWSDDQPTDLPRIVANIAGLWPSVEADAKARTTPSLELALMWHQAIYDGVSVPDADYVGAIRDSDPAHPCLVDYEVGVGSAPGVLARDVPDALDAYIRAVRQVIASLDRAVPSATTPNEGPVVMATVRLCAYAHGEWVRIHPFANGNGRTARVWANWLAVRYGLPGFVRIKPRPEDALFAGAAAMSMRGDHRATEVLFVAMLNDALALPQPS
jgi:hypothetical protein